MTGQGARTRTAAAQSREGTHAQQQRAGRVHSTEHGAGRAGTARRIRQHSTTALRRPISQYEARTREGGAVGIPPGDVYFMPMSAEEKEEFIAKLALGEAATTKARNATKLQLD